MTKKRTRKKATEEEVKVPQEVVAEEVPQGIVDKGIGENPGTPGEPGIPELPKLLRWKKIGNGAFLFKNRYIKPNQEFFAFEHEIPKAFRDVVILLDEVSDPLEVKGVVTTYSVQQIEGTEMWNVVDKMGKVVNENPLTEKQANDLLNAIK